MAYKTTKGEGLVLRGQRKRMLIGTSLSGSKINTVTLRRAQQGQGACRYFDNDKATMNLLKVIIRLVIGFLFWMLIASWAVFVFNTIYYLATGGPERVVHWYMHISGGIQILSVSNGTAVVRLTPWNLRRFLVNQIVLLAITVALYFLRRRPSRFGTSSGLIT